MKHIHSVTTKPQVAQTENFEAKLDFKVELTDQIIDFIFAITI